MRDYRKAVVAVLAKYYAVDGGAIRFRVNTMRSLRATGASPAYVALAIARSRKLSQPEVRSPNGWPLTSVGAALDDRAKRSAWVKAEAVRRQLSLF